MAQVHTIHCPPFKHSDGARQVERGFDVLGTRLSAPSAAAGLHIVATPIGNLADVTLRALQTLAGVDLVAAEDTRHTGRLLAHYGITQRLVRYDEHGAKAQRPFLLEALADKKSVALVSDAGTPLVSDPGYRLVREARTAGLPVYTVPGPAAPIAALAIAGLPTDAFHFAGFLPVKAGQRALRIDELKAIRATLVLFESPHRLAETLAALAAGLGAREAAVARELTKRFEEVITGTLASLAARIEETPVKGEIVILIGPPSHQSSADNLDALLTDALARLPASAAAAQVAQATGVPRKDVYARALTLKNMR